MEHALAVGKRIYPRKIICAEGPPASYCCAVHGIPQESYVLRVRPVNATL